MRVVARLQGCGIKGICGDFEGMVDLQFRRNAAAKGQFGQAKPAGLADSLCDVQRVPVRSCQLCSLCLGLLSNLFDSHRPPGYDQANLCR